MAEKIINILDYAVFPIFLFVLLLQLGTFLICQFFLFVGGFSTDDLPMLTILLLLPFIVGGTFMPLLFIYDYGKPDLSKIGTFRARLESVMLRLMAFLTALAFVLCALFWFSYPSLPRFESVTFIQAGVFTLLVAFDNEVTKKYLTKLDKPKPQPIIISQRADPIIV